LALHDEAQAPVPTSGPAGRHADCLCAPDLPSRASTSPSPSGASRR